ncbi:hypothetical protein [Methylobacter tundripaludum]|jgi:hypothetical protein|nr:hypothetical protein [Methylobacter tundripaludum]MDP1772434.1 hypothetical protein [Methylobacter sp.]
MSILKLIFGLISAFLFSSVFLVSLLGRAAFPEGNVIDIVRAVLG